MPRQFHVVLPSNDLSFPTNKTNNFRISLPKALRFEEKYLCGLKSIVFPHSWNSLGAIEQQHISLFLGNNEIRIGVPPGSYTSVESLIQTLNSLINNGIAEYWKQNRETPAKRSKRATQLPKPEVDTSLTNRDLQEEVKAVINSGIAPVNGNPSTAPPTTKGPSVSNEAKNPASGTQKQKTSSTASKQTMVPNASVPSNLDREGKQTQTAVVKASNTGTVQPTLLPKPATTASKDNSAQNAKEVSVPAAPRQNLPLAPTTASAPKETLATHTPDVKQNESSHKPPVANDKANTTDIALPPTRSTAQKVTNVPAEITKEDGAKDVKRKFKLGIVLQGDGEFKFDQEKQKVVFKNSKKNIDAIALSKQLAYILGFTDNQTIEHNVVATFAPDITGGIKSLAVYVNGLINNVIVGSAHVPLLRFVNVSGKHGENIEVIYDTPLFCEVACKEIDVLHVQIQTDEGEPVPFQFGNVVITLVFKQMIGY